MSQMEKFSDSLKMGGHISKEQRVTVVTNEGRDSQVDNWCGEDGKKRKQVRQYSMTGCEDDVIITFDFANNEVMTRAREILILVDKPGSG